MRAAMGGSSAAQPSGRTAVAHSREFADLIKCIGECRSKQEEDRIMSQEVTDLKKVFQSPSLDKAKMREYLLRLVYVEMLGHDAAFAYIHVVNACGDKNWVMKKLGYLATTLFLDEDSEYIIMLVNTIMKDLRDENPLVVCSALQAVCRLTNNDTVEGFMPLVLNVVKHPKEIVKKKAVMVLHRFLQIRPSLRDDLDKHLRTTLCDKDPSVMSASLCALHEVIKEMPSAYKNLTASFVSILKQVAEHRLPKAYDYHKTPAPFIQIKILKILAFLGKDDKASSDHMYTVISDVMRRANTGHTIGNAVIYECVRTITVIFPNATLLQSAAEMVATFLRSSNHNLKYIGIDSLAEVVAINPKYAQEQQMAVIDCLEDPDESLKRKTLELLYKMTKPGNVEVIVERMLNYLGSTTDPHNKAETSTRISELAERYAPDNVWFIEVMNDVFRLGGDAVEAKLGTNIMRIIAEGTGEDDPQGDTQLRANAVQSYLELLELPKISDVLLKVIFWVLGEYGAQHVPQGAPAVIAKLVTVLDKQTVSDSARGYLLSALGKLCCQTGASLTREAEAFVRSAASSRNADLQQRALEIQALWSCDRSSQVVALPADASCEDLEIDEGMSFLSSYVEAALQAGAAPYIPQHVRDGQDILEAAGAASGTGGLRFEAYATAAAPDPLGSAPVTLGGVEGSMSPGRAADGNSGGGGAPSLSSSGPQLRISGPRKWGPATFQASPSASSSPARPASQQPPGAHVAAATDAALQAPAEGSSSPGDPVDNEKANLANLLFGGGGDSGGRGRGGRRGSSRAQAGTGAAAAAAPAAPVQDLLMDFDTPTKEPPPAPEQSPMDLLAELGDLSMDPTPSAGVQQPQIDPMAAFAAAPLVPQAAAQPQMGMMGMGGQAPGMMMPQQQQMGMMGAGGMMMGMGMQQQQQQPQQQMGMMGMGMAGGNGAAAAVKPPAEKAKLGEKPKNDPFADLLG